MIRKVFALAAAAVVCLVGTAQAQGSADDGETVFKKCMTCHRIGPEAKNLIGPNLTGVIGRQAGTQEGFAYSDLNKLAGQNGLVWTDELIFKNLEDPTPFLKQFLTDKGKGDLAEGAAKMAFKLADEQDRRDVIAYLKTFSPPK